MKAVILAGGLGTRMREETEFKPKPMVEIGNMPVLLHLMKILGSQGVREFIICVGYRGDYIRDYFLNFKSRFSDFTVSTSAERSVTYHAGSKAPDWKVTIAETGALTPTGGRLKRIQDYVGQERFLATYGDGLADIDLAKLLSAHESSGKIATLTTAVPRSRFGVVESESSGLVRAFREKPAGSENINIGFFVFEHGVFDFLTEDSTLENEPLQSLVRAGQLNSFRHDGFFQPMDTQREVDDLRDLWSRGRAPWAIWESSESSRES
jgi:glucose-1-phosphate cytidylyltransferase